MPSSPDETDQPLLTSEQADAMRAEMAYMRKPKVHPLVLIALFALVYLIAHGLQGGGASDAVCVAGPGATGQLCQ